MPVSGNSEQERDERLAAIARFIDTHREHMFLITCREDEYGILRDQQATFKLLQFKLWPWTQKMFDDYLKIRLQETASLSRIRRTLSQADQSPEWQQFSRSALYASLLLDTYTGAGSQTGGELWDRFFQKHLKPHLADELEYDQVMADLSSLAFYATKYPDRTPPVSSHTSRIGSAAGLLDQEGSQFRIRPFQQYFTARYLWHKIKTDPNTELLELEHPSVHLTFAFLAELAGSDPAFASYEKKYIVQMLLNQLAAAGYSYNVVYHVRDIIKAALAEALRPRSPRTQRCAQDGNPGDRGARQTDLAGGVVCQTAGWPRNLTRPRHLSDHFVLRAASQRNLWPDLGLLPRLDI